MNSMELTATRSPMAGKGGAWKCKKNLGKPKFSDASTLGPGLKFLLRTRELEVSKPDKEINFFACSKPLMQPHAPHESGYFGRVSPGRT